MNWKQAVLTVVMLVIAIAVPWYSVGMLLMGIAFGVVACALLNN